MGNTGCIYSPVKRFAPVYTCISLDPHCEEKAFRINLDNKETD